MAKISKYPEDTAPNPNKFLLVEGLARDGKYKTKVGNLTALAFHNRMNPVWSDLVESTARLAPLMIVALGTGTIAAISSEADHPGILRMASSATANTGYNITLNGATAVMISGGEVAEFIARFPSTANRAARLGFQDSLTQVDSVDAIYLILGTLVLSGRCISNSNQSNTATTYTITANVWYRFKLVVNSDATRVDFYVYDMSGTLLWTDSVTSNIPSGAGRETGFGAKSYKVTAGAADLMDIDWMKYSNEKVLTR